MKYKSLCLAFAMSLSLISNALAFDDISGTEWYASYVQDLSNRNIINGYEDNTFRALSNITNGEVLKIVISSIDELPITSDLDSHWASGYLNKAINLGLPITSDINLNANATRYFVAEMLLEILQANTINIASPFEDIDDDIINTLYELGIVNGEFVDNKRYFYGDNDITRAEVSALVVRTMKIYDKNITKPTYNHVTIETTQTPTTIEEFKNIIIDIVVNDKGSQKVLYPEIGFYEMRDEFKYQDMASKAFYEVFDEYPEYFTFANQISVPMSGTLSESDLTIEVSSSYFNAEQITDMKKSFFEEVENILHILKLNGSILESMTQYQKAEVFFEWIILNNEYDLNYEKVSYTAYGITHYNRAVCQGYVALFNALCKMEEIEAYGMSGIANDGEHIWSYVNLDGEWCYVDPTFADPVPNQPNYCDFSFFNISEENLRKTHTF